MLQTIAVGLVSDRAEIIKGKFSSKFELTQIIEQAKLDDSKFLPFTRNRKYDSGSSARQENYFFGRSIAPFPVKNLRIVALDLLSTSRTFMLVGDIDEPSSFQLHAICETDIKRPTAKESKERN